MKKIKLYHATNKSFIKPDLNLAKLSSDFSRGFYLFENLELAKSWACKKNGNLQIHEYELDLSDLSVYQFDLDLKWLAIVCLNRQYLGYQYLSNLDLSQYDDYDVLIAPTIDQDNFGIINDFFRELNNINNIIEYIKLLGVNYQVVLKSEKSISCLNKIQTITINLNQSKDLYLKTSNQRIEKLNQLMIKKGQTDVDQKEYLLKYERFEVAKAMGEVFEYAVGEFYYDLFSFIKIFLNTNLFERFENDFSLYFQSPRYIIETMWQETGNKINKINDYEKSKLFYLMHIGYWFGYFICRWKINEGITGYDILNNYDITRIILNYENLHQKSLNEIIDEIKNNEIYFNH
ncbi:DUF3990 domain-containing protein [uncultured Thomasclavelia sp.]|uniref:DUF3990 domain-containing protein n=1 Tax=uncultured Thomasclavelia sp. TaxID=3025759 RepID=UPI0026002255|nr:DUF3990 domain-containing protein [uncultured Thomasclavelia sp.]